MGQLGLQARPPGLRVQLSLTPTSPPRRPTETANCSEPRSVQEAGQLPSWYLSREPRSGTDRPRASAPPCPLCGSEPETPRPGPTVGDAKEQAGWRPPTQGTHVVAEAHVHPAVQHDVLARNGDQDAASAHVLASPCTGGQERGATTLLSPKLPLQGWPQPQGQGPAACSRPLKDPLGPWPCRTLCGCCVDKV